MSGVFDAEAKIFDREDGTEVLTLKVPKREYSEIHIDLGILRKELDKPKPNEFKI